MKTAGLSLRDRDIAKTRRRRLVLGAVYWLACLLPAATFLTFIIFLWSDK